MNTATNINMCIVGFDMEVPEDTLVLRAIQGQRVQNFDANIVAINNFFSDEDPKVEFRKLLCFEKTSQDSVRKIYKKKRYLVL